MDSTFVIPDLHLDLTYYGLDRTEEIFERLEEIRSRQSLFTNVRIIWLGDIFDSPNVPYQLISRFITFLKSCTNAKHIILKGNHDGEPDSRKGSPLQVIAASGVANIIWEPEIIENELFIPYCTQEALDKFYNERIKYYQEGFFKCTYTHCDIPDVIRGFEQQLGRGAPCLLPDWVKLYTQNLLAGHIHKPQSIWNGKGFIVGSLIAVDASESNDNKNYLIIDHSNFCIQWINVAQTPILQYKIDYKAGCNDVQDLLDPRHDLDFEKSIVLVNIICPHNLAHEIDQIKLKDSLRKRCKHVQFDCKIVKDRHFKIPELDKTLSDRVCTEKYFEKMGILDKAELMKELDDEKIFDV